MARIILAVDYDVEANLLEGIIRAGHEIVDRVTGAASLAAAVERARPELVLAQAGPETLNPRSLAACDGAGARTIAVVGNEAERRQATELGLVDRIRADDRWDAVERLLEGEAARAAPPVTAQTEPEEPPRSRKDRRREESRRGRRSPQREVPPPIEPSAPPVPAPGRILAVWGPHGSPGVTTVAIALAASLVNQGRRVLLVDADTYGGAVAPALGIADEAPGLAAACRLAGAGSLSAVELDRVSSEVACARGTLRVLSGISNPARWPELPSERMRAVLGLARDEYEFVVVDVGFNLERDEELVSDVAAPRRNAAAHAAIEVADAVVAVGEATPVGLQRYLRARLGLVDLRGDATHLETVITRLRRGAVGADSAGQVRQVLLRFGGIERATLLPDDSKAVDRAMAEAIAVVDAAPRSQLAKQLDALALRLGHVADAAAPLPADLQSDRSLVQ
ncbi:MULTISPECIES: AAA family ATPase [Gulosibacter]|uniref:AAA family ATPase n=1 Tax=Gulosibacter TaxID=256818 RepID=UPI000F62CCE1|nr:MULTISPECIES: regulator [Gulosibacter]